MLEAIVCSNGWDDVTAALQLLSHLDGDALNVALLVPEYQRVAPGFLIKSLSEHYSALGRLAEYKRQFQRAFRRPGDDPSIFSTELETLARRAFMDIDLKIQLQMMQTTALRCLSVRIIEQTPSISMAEECTSATAKNLVPARSAGAAALAISANQALQGGGCLFELPTPPPGSVEP